MTNWPHAVRNRSSLVLTRKFHAGVQERRAQRQERGLGHRHARPKRQS